MYQDLFGLTKPPFNLTPDPAFLYLPPKHLEALAGLTYCILERRGFAVLTGDPGTGKTTLLGSVLSGLPENRVESSIILNPTLNAAEFLEGVLLDFDIPDVPASKAQRLWKLQEFLARTHHQGRYAVLVVDEAHKLSPDVLEEIRLLGNFESAADKFLQILLIGQSEFDAVLDSYDVRQLKQRVALRFKIDPLSAAETSQYLRFRWTKAGGGDALPFSADALTAIGEFSRGIPRLINSLADRVLLMAYAEGCPRIDLGHVRGAAASLALDPPPVKAAATLPSPANGCMADAALPGPLSDIPEFLCAPPQTHSSLLRRLAERFGLPG